GNGPCAIGYAVAQETVEKYADNQELDEVVRALVPLQYAEYDTVDQGIQYGRDDEPGKPQAVGMVPRLNASAGQRKGKHPPCPDLLYVLNYGRSRAHAFQPMPGRVISQIHVARCSFVKRFGWHWVPDTHCSCQPCQQYRLQHWLFQLCRSLPFFHIRAANPACWRIARVLVSRPWRHAQYARPQGLAIMHRRAKALVIVEFSPDAGRSRACGPTGNGGACATSSPAENANMASCQLPATIVPALLSCSARMRIFSWASCS